MLPELRQSPTALNQALIYALQALKEIFAQLEPIEQTIGKVQNGAADDQSYANQLLPAKATLVCLQISKYNSFAKFLLV